VLFKELLSRACFAAKILPHRSLDHGFHEVFAGSSEAFPGGPFSGRASTARDKARQTVMGRGLSQDVACRLSDALAGWPHVPAAMQASLSQMAADSRVEDGEESNERLW